MERVKNPLGSIARKYPTNRDVISKSAKTWLDGKQIDDGAEGLWRVHDKLYDLKDFIHRHPGGAEWLELTKGIDITEQFETHHFTGLAEKTLEKYFVRNAKEPRNYKITFKENGFYRTLKRKAAEKLKTIDKKPLEVSNMISDVMFGSIFLSAILATMTNSYIIALFTGNLMFWMSTIAHNYFHKKDNWRMFCFNITLLIYREWRVTHAMSHHLYTNSYHDIEISFFEPFLQWIPRQKSTLHKIIAPIITPFMYTAMIGFTLVQRTVGYFTKQDKFKLDHLIPFALPLAMFYLGKRDIHQVLSLWLVMVLMCSFLVGFVGLNAGHHHPDVVHEGDELHKSMDFGILQMGTLIDRNDLKKSHFWTLTNFGEHILHHMFPTFDHGILPQFHGILIETCKEFEVELREQPWWPLIYGQFQQLLRTEPKTQKELKIKK